MLDNLGIMYCFVLMAFLFLGTITSAAEKAIETSELVHVGLASNFSEVSSGYTNPYGGYFRDGAELALENSKKTLEAKRIKIIFDEFDYGTSEVKVVEAAKKAVQSKVVAVIGYNYSTQALIAAPIHQAAHLPMLTPSASAHRIATFGLFIHQACIDNVFIGKVLAQVAKERLHAGLAVLAPSVDCAYCSDLSKAFENEFIKLGGQVVANLPSLSTDRNFDSLLKQLNGKKFDVILVPNQELSSARIILALSKIFPSKPFLGGDWWGNTGTGFYSVLEDAPVEGYFISHWNPEINTLKSKKFVSAYSKRFGKIPNDTAVLAYDSTMIMIEAIVKAEKRNRDGVENYLNQMKTFNGVTGKFIFNKNSAPEKSLVLMSASKRKFEMVKVISPKMMKN